MNVARSTENSYCTRSRRPGDKEANCYHNHPHVLFSCSSPSPFRRGRRHGCHHNRKRGGYYCHRGPFVSKADMFQRLQESTTPRPEASPQAQVPSKVQVVAVIDGDTIQVCCIAGKREKVRYIGVNTPETSHPTREVDQLRERSRRGQLQAGGRQARPRGVRCGEARPVRAAAGLRVFRGRQASRTLDWQRGMATPRS